MPYGLSQQRTVLLVDDEELLRRLLTRMLMDAGCVVLEAENGATALETAGRLENGLSLVVTDIHMPVMDGLHFAREFRPMYPAVPIVYITGGEAGTTLDGAPNGVLLRKPFRVDAFLSTVERVIGP